MNRTVLIAEDDASVRHSLKKLLEARGYRVLTARDSAETLDWFARESVDVVVMDVSLGEDDGWETFARMAAMNDSVPVVIVTAEFGQRERAIAAGAEALIEKPMDVSSFLEIVEQLSTKAREGGVRRICGEERYCRYVSRLGNALRQDLETRYATPLDMAWYDRLRLVPVVEDK